MTRPNATPRFDCSRGAPLGRGDYSDGSPDLANRFYLQAVPINSQGYDQSGAYWGHGLPLWFASNGGWDEYFRAQDREAAKASIRNVWPNARFWR